MTDKDKVPEKIDLNEILGEDADEVSDEIWERLDPALSGPVCLLVVGEPKRLASRVGDLEQRAGRLGLRAAIVAEAGSGVLQCALCERVLK